MLFSASTVMASAANAGRCEIPGIGGAPKHLREQTPCLQRRAVLHEPNFVEGSQQGANLHALLCKGSTWKSPSPVCFEVKGELDAGDW